MRASDVKNTNWADTLGMVLARNVERSMASPRAGTPEHTTWLKDFIRQGVDFIIRDCIDERYPIRKVESLK